IFLLLAASGLAEILTKESGLPGQNPPQQRSRLMRQAIHGLGLAVLVGTMAFLPAFISAQDAKAKVTSSDKIKLKVEADKAGADGKQNVMLSLDIEKGWHVYANPVGDDLLEDAATKLTFLADGSPVEAKVEYPKGKTVTAGPDRYNVYEDSVTIKATVQRPK